MNLPTIHWTRILPLSHTVPMEYGVGPRALDMLKMTANEATFRGTVTIAMVCSTIRIATAIAIATGTIVIMVEQPTPSK